MIDEHDHTICDDCGAWEASVQTYIEENGQDHDLCAACAQLESNFAITGGGNVQTQKHSTKYTGVKVFSATKHTDRDCLGETITHWITRNKDVSIVETVVTQSSDSDFHCLAITVFYTGTLNR